MSSQMRVYSGCAKMDADRVFKPVRNTQRRHLRLAMMFNNPKTKKSAVKIRKVAKKNHPRQVPPVSSWIQPKKVFTLTILQNFDEFSCPKSFWSHFSVVLSDEKMIWDWMRNLCDFFDLLSDGEKTFEMKIRENSLVVEITCGIFTFLFVNQTCLKISFE